MVISGDELRRLLLGERIVAIVRGDDHDAALASVTTLFDAGLRCFEVSLSGADAIGLLRACRTRLPSSVLLGAGTLLSAMHAEEVIEAGASFALTPALGPAVDRCHELGLPVVAGAFTPSEVLAAHDHGAAAVKLFPASLGGVDYLKALRAPMPHVPFVPVGGIGADDARAYLDAGAIAVGIGSPLFGDALRGGSQDDLAGRAHQFRAAAGIERAG